MSAAGPTPLFEAIVAPRRALLPLVRGALAAVVLEGLLLAVFAGAAPRALAPRVPERAELTVTLLDRPPAPRDDAPPSSAAPGAEPLPGVPAPPPLVAKVRRAPARTPRPVASAPVAPVTGVSPPSPPSLDKSADLSAPAVTPTADVSADGARGDKGAADGERGSAGAGASGSATGGAGGGSSVVLPFLDGMTRPTLIAKVDPVYTREAREARASGLILAKCVITVAGRLERCRIVKGLPSMDQAVLAALSQWRYAPVLYQGKPTAVEYVIPIRLLGP